MPPEDRVWPDQQPQAPQRRPRQRVQQRGLPRSIDRLEPDLLPVEVALQELMPQRQDLDVLVAVAARQQPQQGERVRDGRVGQPQQHEPGAGDALDSDQDQIRTPQRVPRLRG